MMRMQCSAQGGFTLIEFAMLSSILALLAVVALPLYVRATDEGKEAETGNALQEIRIAVERYMVDSGEFPPYLLGGDNAGWTVWRDRWNGVNDIEMSGGRVATNGKVRDPLIEYGYLSSYPENPFVDNGRTTLLRTNVDGTDMPGDGDPRFGYKGNVMGMGLDDMNLFKGAIHLGGFFWSEIEMRRTLDRGDWKNVPDEFLSISTSMYYAFGGFRDPRRPGEGHVFITAWPGNFFYKSAADVIWPGRFGWTCPVPNTNSVGGPRDRYIMGSYGGIGSVGLDVIRLEAWTPDGNPVQWRCPEPFSDICWECGYTDLGGGFGQAGGLPEVFGGGDEWTGPWWYYNVGGRNSGDFIHGAPDGVPDGVILVFTDDGTEMRWPEGRMEF